MLSFEEWCHSTGMDETRICDTDLVSMTILKECWDYREKEIQELKQKLKEAIYIIKVLESIRKY